MHSENWDDLRFVLAVARAGSVSQAARDLGVNHATVLRRVAQFEARVGRAVFRKSVRGYEIDPENLRIIEALREVEGAVRSADRMIRAGEAPLAGVVRVTSTDTFCTAVLPPLVARLQARARGVRFELLSTNAHLDLARLHADVTVRPAFKLGEDLRGEVAGHIGFGVYMRQGGGVDTWLGLSGQLARLPITERLNAYLAETKARVVGTADSFLTLRELVAEGMGMGLLPCIIGAPDARLKACPDPFEMPRTPVWVASHADLVDVSRIRQARQLLGAGLAEQIARLEGDA